MTNLQNAIQTLQLNNKLVILRSCGGSKQRELLASLTQDYAKVDLSLPNLRLQEQQNPQLFAEGLRLPVYLADLQCAPSLLSVLLSCKLTLGQIIASCSQSYYLEELAAQADAGSVAFVELPLQVADAFVRKPFAPQESYLQNLRGAEKRQLVAAMLGEREVYSSWVRRVLQQDIMERTTVSDEVKFYRFLCAVASMAGCVVNYTILANNVGITAPTAKQWLQFLAGTGLVYLLPPVEHVAGKRLVKAPKVYFREAGAAAHLLQLYDGASLLQSVYFKNLYENYVVSALRESYLRWGQEPDFRFYRDSNNKEISLLVQAQGVLYPVMICQETFSTNRLGKFFALLPGYAEEQGLQLGTGCMITLGGECMQVSGGLWQINADVL
ncbi:MAG: DUF4143 domain-containing protein [Phascolarctobacterium sp.]|uniref:DUF4143 domain-containing protein n=1 Tax=Phascolarctobacterium sp. TaxID=2049039 RepID=UPI0026DC1BD9|nr:DUF4143 domain-containing protein [Phascolarctobacterium sp.]MDO4920851.1 DUF4143 domain-containing protein [Phascolarctobacterium sp.]